MCEDFIGLHIPSFSSLYNTETFYGGVVLYGFNFHMNW